LSELGHRQAAALADWLDPVDALVSSPLARAVQTAAPLAEGRALEPQVVDEIAEFDRDENYYVPLEEMRAENHPRLQALIDGDIPDEFRVAAIAAIGAVIADNPGRTVAMVCHGGVINCYLSDLLGLDQPMFFEPTYTGVSRVRASRNGVRSLVSINETAHLRGL
jgi:probable phosphoglycerate mutase